MIDELKRGMKLIKYGFNLKSSILAGTLFFLLGIVLNIVDHEASLLGGLYIILGPMMLTHIIFTLSCANSVAASPQKRVLEMWLPSLTEFVMVVLSYIIVIAITLLKIFETHRAPELEDGYLKNLVCIGMVGGILILYMAMAYKYFFASVFTIGFVYAVLMALDKVLLLINIHLTVVTAALIGFCFIALGAVMSIILRKAFYKKPVSKYAVGGALRKYL